MWKLTLLLTLTLIDSLPTSEDFVPNDISHAAAYGCVVAGDKGPPPFVEAQVFVKTVIDNPNWDYKPKIARYPMAGGVYKANHDCIKWYQDVEKAMLKAAADATKADQGASKQP